MLKLGGIYKIKWDERPFRVIGFDEIEVFYDVQFFEDIWSFSGNFKQKCYFYRTFAYSFISNSKAIGFEPLNEQEHNIYRPDLPLRVCRSKEINWNKMDILTFDDIFNTIEKLSDKSFCNDKIQTNKIVLIPHGNKGGLKKGTIIHSNNEKYFEASELIWKAKELQEAVNKQISKGIGIYRLGYEKGLPSYYIGEYLDAAGLLT